MTEEIPQLLSIKPSEDATAIFDDVEFESPEEEDYPDKLPHEFRVGVVFQKKMKEKDLWNSFGWIFEQREHSHDEEEKNEKDSDVFPASVRALGVFEQQGQMMAVPLFENALEEDDEPVTKGYLGALQAKKRRAAKKKREPVFSLVYFYTNLVNPKDSGEEDDDDCGGCCDDDHCTDSHCGKNDDAEEMETDCCEDENCEGHDEEDESELTEPEILTKDDLQLLVDQITKAAKEVDPQSKIVLDCSPIEGETLANKLAEVLDFSDRTISIVVKSKDGGFKGPEVWDTMLSMSFGYDADNKSFVFLDEDPHANPEEIEEGSDILFYADSSQIPAFDAVMLASPSYTLRDLLFSLYLPHCPDPVQVIQFMIRAANYTAKRLGGEVLNELEKPFNWSEFEAEVKEVVEKMKECGIVPGSPVSRELF